MVAVAGVEVESVEGVAHRTDGIGLLTDPLDDLALEPQGLVRVLEDGRGIFGSVHDIVGHQAPLGLMVIDVGLGEDLLGVIGRSPSHLRVVVDEVDLVADQLEEPHRRGVADSQVPTCVNRLILDPGDASDPTVGASRRHLLAEHSPGDRRLKRLLGRAGVLSRHLAAQPARTELGERVPRSLLRRQYDAVLGLELVEILREVVVAIQPQGIDGVLRVGIPGIEVKSVLLDPQGPAGLLGTDRLGLGHLAEVVEVPCRPLCGALDADPTAHLRVDRRQRPRLDLLGPRGILGANLAVLRDVEAMRRR